MDFPVGVELLPNFLLSYMEVPFVQLRHTLGATGEGRVYYELSYFAKAEMKQERRERFERDLWELT
jgi:hypothetical protein